MADQRPHARIWLAAVLAFAVSFWVFDLVGLGSGAPALLDDVWEYGVAARHLLAGEGFRTSVIHPPLWALRDANLTVPLLVHGPPLPLLYAPALALLGPAALDHVAYLSALMALLTALALFRLGARHGGPLVGATAAVLFTLTPHTIRAVHHDASEVAGALLLTLIFLLLARERPHRNAAALAMGLGVLVRPEMALALPGLSLLAGGGGTVALIVGIAVVAGPWWWHNFRAVGSPFFNLSTYMLVGYSPRWPDLTVLRDFSLVPERWPQVLSEQASGLPAKAWENLPHALKRALMAPNALTGWLAAVGLVVGVARTSIRWVALAALLCALIPVAIMTLMVYDTRYLVPFLPLWSLAAALGIEWLWGRLPRLGRAPAWPAVLLLLVLPATVTTLAHESRESRSLRLRLAADRAALASRVTPAATLPRLTATGLERPGRAAYAPPRLMFSDTPDFVAWTTGRPTVWVTRAEYAKLPAPGEPAPAAPPALPVRGASRDTWFHEDPR